MRTQDEGRLTSTLGASVGSGRILIHMALVCVPIMVVSSGAYLAMALAHAGSLDREGDALDLEKLGRVSWRLALLAAILCSGFRYWSGLY